MKRPIRLTLDPHRIGLALVLVFLAGCTVFEAQHSSRSRKPGLATAPSPAPNSSATLTKVQNEIFTPKCAIPDCHASKAPGAEEGPPEGLILENGKSHEAIVKVQAHEFDLLRVAPGDPDNSYLVRKITPGAQIAWHRMPLDHPELKDSERQLIRDWIAAGAPKN